MDMYVKMSRFNKGYSVTLKGFDALVFFGRVTPEDKYGYTGLIPAFSDTPAVDPQVYYTISNDGSHVYWQRNIRLSPREETT